MILTSPSKHQQISSKKRIKIRSNSPTRELRLQVEPVRISRQETSRSEDAIDPKKKAFRVFNEICKLQLAEVSIPSAVQLNRQLDRRWHEKAIKHLKKESGRETPIKLFSLFQSAQKCSCLHTYKRELSPVTEAFVMHAVVARGSPYLQDFKQDFGSLTFKDFQETLLQGIGEQASCVTATNIEKS